VGATRFFAVELRRASILQGAQDYKLLGEELTGQKQGKKKGWDFHSEKVLP